MYIRSFAAIDRRTIVQSFNPYRTASSNSTPLQVGNGNFAFGADASGLQTWLPYSTLSSWCWHNSSLPSTPNQTEPSDFTGLDWLTHDRLVNYAQPNPAEAEISQWMIANPHRVNLGRVGLWFGDRDVLEEDVENTEQALDMYTEPADAAFYNVDGTGMHINTNAEHIRSASEHYWQEFWEDGAFLDLTGSDNANATELQRRIVQSQYILSVNEAGFDPPQESGLVNNGWYGKFHAEMWLWHIGHWGRWGRWALQDRSVPGVYKRFLSTSLERAHRQGYDGARWGKMSDPTGRSAPGEINSLLIWQQPHPMYFAELDYRSHPNNQTLEKWAGILWHTAEFMASYAYWNETTGVYDLGPPMYPSSENTDPNATMNTAFELAYWKMGLSIACEWQARQGKESPERWTHVAEHLAPLPVQNETYVIFEGIENMWSTEDYTEDHPSMLGLYGWLPPQPDQFNLTIMQNTRDKVYETWNFTYSFGWDFPLLSMNAARLGDVDEAVAWLLDENFAFDDAGYHVGGARVPTPYMPGAASLLWAVALLAGGWDGSEGGHWPEGWKVESEGFVPQL
ncbi:hypothetical protein D0867_03361 [Hortaea werneckii]|uniref:Uncharacterized protein n=1 Tax=Hortaea werneckii TaxID=91943 RepID=A0A3M7A293_HORWE|nr:hypothetical protein D0867_03361 [Hortaea werneckii]